jgi:hypothetical protein
MKYNGNVFSENIVETGIESINGCAPIMSIRKVQVSDEAGQDDEIKISLISSHFKKIMILMGFDLNDDCLRETPDRITKMYVKEIFSEEF